jgi:uncharacterized protein (DUF2384 family)
MPHAIQTETHRDRSPTPGPLAAFFALADVWKLTTDQQIVLLGGPARSTYFKWKKEGGTLSVDQEDRVSHLLSIYKALQVLFPEPERADAWLSRPHRFFGDRSAKDVMLGGRLEDIARVRDFVDAQRGG